MPSTPEESYAWPVAASGDALPSQPIDATSEPGLIAALQRNLTWTGIDFPVSGEWDRATIAAIKKFQSKQHLKSTGLADAATVRALAEVSRHGQLDPRCVRTGVVLCVDKTQKMLRFVENGAVLRAIDVNIGPEKGDPKFRQYSRTREGEFKIFHKARFEISTLYGTPMPYMMMFNGGEGFHYSKYFDQTGYADTSMGCVTVSDKATLKWIFERSPMKTTTVVYS